jgi:ketosteroid isomerase-like protein
VRGALEASSQGDVGVFFRLADPDCRVYPRPAEPGVAAEYQGLDGLMDYLTNWYSQWDEYEFEPVEIVDAGEYVLVVLRERGRMERTGVEVEHEFSHSFVLRDGQLVEWRAYDGYAEALEAVGLSE